MRDVFKEFASKNYLLERKSVVDRYKINNRLSTKEPLPFAKNHDPIKEINFEYYNKLKELCNEVNIEYAYCVANEFKAFTYRHQQLLQSNNIDNKLEHSKLSKLFNNSIPDYYFYIGNNPHLIDNDKLVETRKEIEKFFGPTTNISVPIGDTIVSNTKKEQTIEANDQSLKIMSRMIAILILVALIIFIIQMGG